jgi:Zn-dependent peptidase ImmA (M78 family)/DNA-binding XRE family transcriptional regulator
LGDWEIDKLTEDMSITVTPSIVKWARENLGYSVNELSELIPLSKSDYEGWENGSIVPTLDKFRAFSRIVNQPIAFFFRPNPPEVEPLPKDYRTLPSEDRIAISPETRKVIQEVQDKQRIFIELLDELKKNELVGIIQNLSDPEGNATDIRKKFDVSFAQQSAWKSDYTAFKEWRGILEQHGFLVFQYKMPVNEIRGFSIPNDVAPVIVTNKNDHIRSQIFTLFHEMSHILLNKGSLCLPERWSFTGTGEIAKVEIFCNHFAGAFIVPHDYLLSHKYLKGDQKITIEMERIIGGISNSFGVSKEVIIRRLVILKKIPQSDYRTWRKYHSGTPDTAPAGGGGSGRDMANECVGKNGSNFTSQVLNSYRNDKITYADIAESLNIKTKYIPRLEKIVGG